MAQVMIDSSKLKDSQIIKKKLIETIDDRTSRNSKINMLRTDILIKTENRNKPER